MRRTIGSGLVLFLLAIGVPPAGATFPGSNGVIGFSSVGRDESAVAIVQPDGSGLTFLTAADGRDDYEPDWTSDGSMIVFDTERRSVERIWTMASDGSDQTPIFTAPDDLYGIFGPVWSPDGSQIAFCSLSQAARLTIYTIAADGTTLTAISQPNADECDPDWSPDGTRIAFTSWSHGGVWTMDPDGTDRTRVTTGGSGPSWSPDGSEIAFARGRHQSDLFIVGADGSGEVRLTDTPRRAEYGPAFSPDGTLVGFDRSTLSGDDSDVWTITTDGLTRQRVTDTRRQEYSVAWQPV